MLADRPPATVDSSSSELCRAALTAYRALFGRLTWCEPDDGFREAFYSGCRSIEALMGARDWLVSGVIARDAGRLVAGLSELFGDDIPQAIFRFPAAFLTIVERRDTALGDPARGRRQSDPRVRRAIAALDRAGSPRYRT